MSDVLQSPASVEVTDSEIVSYALWTAQQRRTSATSFPVVAGCPSPNRGDEMWRVMGHLCYGRASITRDTVTVLLAARFAAVSAVAQADMPNDSRSAEDAVVSFT
ncbi:hypothetical protein LSAT2_013097 [Lamellibrachia satsuma]|nr:hypothetical protein LSAT2_013097 [Lamellibrachia satsuma]